MGENLDIHRILAGYSIFMGLLILVALFVIETLYHLIAETITALLLLISGFGLLKKRRWGFQIFSISMGSLLYATIMGIGFYIRTDFVFLLGMSIMLCLLTIFFIGLSFYENIQ